MRVPPRGWVSDPAPGGAGSGSSESGSCSAVDVRAGWPAEQPQVDAGSAVVDVVLVVQQTDLAAGSQQASCAFGEQQLLSSAMTRVLPAPRGAGGSRSTARVAPTRSRPRRRAP